MTKKEFIDKFAANSEITKKDAEKYLGTFLGTIEDALATGESVAFVGWGKWEVVEREAREGRNPSTGAKIKIAAKKVVKFRVGSTLETKVNQPAPKAKAKAKK